MAGELILQTELDNIKKQEREKSLGEYENVYPYPNYGNWFDCKDWH